MILIECVNAYMAVQALMEIECDYRTAHALVCLKKQLLPHVEFFASEERKLVEAYAAKDEGDRVKMEGARFIFADGADAAEYARLRTELGAVEVEERFAPLHVSLPERIKPIYVEALERFVIFDAGGGDFT